MAINPFPRIQPLDIPTYLPSAARAPEGTFSNIASIGDAIGAYRERNAMGEILKSAVDPQTGALDMQKAATAIALSGRDPAKYLTLLEAEARRKEAADFRGQSLDIARQGKDIQERQFKLEQERANRGTRQVVPPSLMSPGGVYDIPLEGDPRFRPFPQPPSIGPQSALEPAVEPPVPMAAAEPPVPMAAVEPGPENAPPYQVAGPPTPPPQAPARVVPAEPAAQPAATPDRNEAFLQRLPPNARTIVKGVANYEIDPSTLTGKDREEVIAAAKLYRPDYNMTEYQKRGSPPSGEIAARIGLAKAFIESVPQIRERIQADELNSAGGRGMAVIGQGGAGELRRAIDEGAEALLRGLTGAGMSNTEAANYQRRYQFSPFDTKETQLRKLNELERAHRFVATEVMSGRGNESLLKGFQSQFGKPVTEEAAVSVAKNDAEINKLVSKAKAAIARDPKGYDEAIKILQQRLPKGVDARRLLER